MQQKELSLLAHELRLSILEMLVEARSGHPGGSLSAIDLMTALWFHEMRGAEPSVPHDDPSRDRFILSKGHAVPALYAILAKKGYFSPDLLRTLRKTGSPLQGHPDRARMPIVEASTGSLGQGLSVAQGLAMGLRMNGGKSMVYCMVGDGETEEGQIWEAAMSAPKFKLSNFCVIQDNNKGQIDGPVSQVMPLEPIVDKWKSFGWNVIEIDGHDMKQILAAYAEARKHADRGEGKPTFILAQTVKGKGVSWMEGKIEWHGAVPKPEEGEKAKKEIQALIAQLQGGK